jgi:hypothetical protein
VTAAPQPPAPAPPCGREVIDARALAIPEPPAQTETVWQRFVRFLRGLLGLDSGTPDPGNGFPGEQFPPEEIPPDQGPAEGPLGSGGGKG